MADRLTIHSELISLILGQLLVRGIAQTDLSCEDFRAPFSADIPDEQEFDQEFSDVLGWLEHEGYVRTAGAYSGTNGDVCFSQCALTGHCLAALDQKIDAFGGMTARDVIQASNSGDVQAGNYVKAGSFLGGLFGGFVSSAGGS